MTDGDHKSPFIGKKVLHVGCGSSPLPAWLADNVETRFDIDPNANPDILGDMRDVAAAVGEQKFDIIYSNHAVEHLYPHEVVPTLMGFKQVLNPDGVAIVVVPNLKGIQPTNDVVYVSPSGPICGLDMYYGLSSVLHAMPYMAHHSGFIKETFEDAFRAAGFENFRVTEDDSFNLIAAGVA
jgi:2-polyprenyl-3-methyl-5-hydroxy-6-metoxy-1,4-benzoquinol methylase